VDPIGPISELTQALDRALDASARIRSTRAVASPEQAQAEGAIISLFSSKGGTGRTFLAANLAAALATQSGGDTAMIDFDLTFGDTMSYFGAEAPLDRDGLAGLAEHSNRFSLRSSGLQVGDHLWAYAMKPDSISPEPVPTDAVARILRTLQANFAYTVVDMPPDFSDQALAVLDLANVICLVTALDVVAVRHLASAYNTLLSLGIPPGRFLLVLNRADSKVKLTASDVEHVLKLRADAMIPSSRLVPLSLNRGSPILLDEPKSNVAKSINALADRILKLHPQGSTLHASEQGEAPVRRGLFRRR
jgi:pilus assembly protein CpaE